MADMVTDAPALALRAPYGLYVTAEDFLRVSVLGIGTQVVVVSGRILTLEGEVKTFDRQLAAPGSRTVPAPLIFSPGPGWIENVTAIAASAGTGLAQTIVTVDLVRGPNAAGGVLATLLQGPLSSLQRLAWPGSPIMTALDISSVLRSIAGTNPAANTEISETVPAGARWKLRALSFVLVTDANAANREVSIVLDDGAAILHISSAGFAHAASLTKRYSAAVIGVTQAPTTALDRQIALPDLWLPGGSRIRTQTTNIQVGDDYGAPQLLVEESLEAA